MSTVLNLATLPPDLKRIVIHMEENAMENVRMISPSWNRMVLEYLKDRRYLLPLERVFLSSDAVDADYQSYGAHDSEMIRINNEEKKKIRMHAIIPEERTGRVGLGKWLNVHATFPGAVEVTCLPQKIDITRREFWKFWLANGMLILPIVMIIAIVGYFTHNFFASKWHCIAVFLLLSLAAIVAAYFVTFVFVGREEREKDEGRCDRLTKFFTSFSQISHLVLYCFTDLRILDKMIFTFGEVHIEKLEVRRSHLSKRLQNRIVKMTKKHGIRYVSIVVLTCDLGSLRKFLIKLAKMGATVNIYEFVVGNKFYEQVLNYFHRPMEFWDTMRSHLEKKGISFRLNTIQDDNFAKLNCASYV